MRILFLKCNKNINYKLILRWINQLYKLLWSKNGLEGFFLNKLCFDLIKQLEGDY